MRDRGIDRFRRGCETRTQAYQAMQAPPPCGGGDRTRRGYLTPQAALVHTRLCVMDPAGGAQPMLLRAGRRSWRWCTTGSSTTLRICARPWRAGCRKRCSNGTRAPTPRPITPPAGAAGHPRRSPVPARGPRRPGGTAPGAHRDALVRPADDRAPGHRLLSAGQPLAGALPHPSGIACVPPGKADAPCPG